MTRATALAQRKVKPAESGPAYELTFDNRPFTEKLFDGTITYSASDGTSEMSVSADATLADYRNSSVKCSVGYGTELWEYFTGKLEEPDDNFYGEPSTATAYGPFRELNEASIGADVSYVNKTLGQAIADLHRRAGIWGGRYEVRGNPKFLLTGDDAGLALTTSFGEGLNTLLETAGWIGTDVPGYLRRYMPKPSARPGAESVATYTEAHYGRNQFHVSQGTRNFYGRVGAFTRNDDGGFAYPPIFININPLGRYRPPPLRTYWLEDFSGTYAQAKAEASRMALQLSAGTYSWSLSDISVNPDLELFSHFTVETTEDRDVGARRKARFEVSYVCSIDEEINLNISRESIPMNVSGQTAIKLREKQIARPFTFNRTDSSVVRL